MSSAPATPDLQDFRISSFQLSEEDATVAPAK